MNLHENKKTFAEAVTATAGHLNIKRHFVEKDYWICRTLQLMARTDTARHAFFKGGTSLTKAYHIGHRFSEDIDIAISRDFLGYEGALSRTQISDKLRRAACSFVRDKMPVDVRDALIAQGIDADAFKVNVNITSVSTTDPETIEIEYQSVLPESPYIRHCVMIEVSGRSMQQPIKVEALQSFIDQYLPESVVAEPTFSIPSVVVPERTCLEKIFLLHEEFAKPTGEIRTLRMSRHLYDLYCLKKKGVAERALHDEQLYRTIIDHRRQFINLKGFDYDTLYPVTLSFLPPEHIMDAWREDYEYMLLHMIYDNEAPTFEQLIEAITELQKEIKTLPYKFC